MPFDIPLSQWFETAWRRLRAPLGRGGAEEPVNQLSFGELLEGLDAPPVEFDPALSLEPLGPGDARLIEREQAWAPLHAALAAWLNGEARMVACFGPPGSGVSTGLNRLARLGRDTFLATGLRHSGHNSSGLSDIFCNTSNALRQWSQHVCYYWRITAHTQQRSQNLGIMRLPT